MDREGNILTEAKYVKIEIPNPEKDIFVCYESEEKGIVLNSKKEVLFEGYDNIQAIKLKNIASLLCYEKNALKYEKDGLYGLIDFNGKVIVKNEYKSIENLQGVEGKFVVSKDGKQGVVNYNGRMLVEPKYDRIASDGYYNNDTKYIKSGFIVSNTTENGYRYGYINYSGEKTLDVEYNDIIRAAIFYYPAFNMREYAYFSKDDKSLSLSIIKYLSLPILSSSFSSSFFPLSWELSSILSKITFFLIF